MRTTDHADPDDPTSMALPVLHDIVRLSDGQEAEVVGRNFGEERGSYYAVRDDSGQVRKVNVSEIVGYPEHDQPLAVEAGATLPNGRRPFHVGDTVRVTASGLGSNDGVVYEIIPDPNSGFWMYVQTAPHQDESGNTVSTTFARLMEDHTPRYGYKVELIEAAPEDAELVPTADLPCEHTTAHHGIAGTELTGCDGCGATWPSDAVSDQAPAELPADELVAGVLNAAMDWHAATQAGSFLDHCLASDALHDAVRAYLPLVGK